MFEKEDSDHEAQMIEAFVGKPDEPDRGLWYANAFAKYNITGEEKMAWAWSWWAFGGGLWYLLYRKAYFAALGLFVLGLVSSVVPFGGIIVWILSGGFGPYFVYKVYKEKKVEIDNLSGDQDKRIELMKELGGYNQWALVAAVIINVVIVIAVIVMFAVLLGISH
jgi:hypothetical protein